MEDNTSKYKLPKPMMYIQCDLNYAVKARRSVRRFDPQPLTHLQISNLLWSCQGITDEARGYRAAPSAGATYPCDVYIQVSGTKDLPDALYRYRHESHELEIHKKGDLRKELKKACFNQGFIEQAPAIILLSAEYKRTSGRYGSRAERYVHMEAGHIGQNIYLQAVGNGLATVAVGAFNDTDVKNVCGLENEPLYIFPVGKKA